MTRRADLRRARAAFLVAGALIAAPTLSASDRAEISAVSQIVPRSQMVVRNRTFDGGYRLFDDRLGIATGARFERIRAVVRRGGFRLRGDSHDIVLRDIDLSLAAPTVPPHLPAGVEVQGTVHDVMVDHVTARDFRMVPREGKYTNGDGFSSERGATRITFRSSQAFDNSDGGFDLKSTDTRLEGTHAERNGFNYRLWGSGQSTRIESVDPRKGHLQFNTEADWHIATLVARATTRAPVIVVTGNATITIDRCELDVPPGTRLVKVENGKSPRVKLGPGCRLPYPDATFPKP